ncbi:other/FunK1 protein kinase [Coprinopsis cinerea okayama7|uniref:Other/FunK1 protein kinase n=1 Tax=Coprinopsis cinerea (strain Okayama-7 / 130 / ATCC MYA-4618 / FGSC 9003) TaxID=240176 RepID=A8NAT8_COPC7|nr:other/FunK1 protein kinase [Coprinopsis cinerea okayama7\|eukprot:XP_001831940.1 other/FunK1 protein kinase [Coprinopsis cinerea okayama7\
MEADVSTCTVGKFFDNYLPNHGMEFDAVVGDLMKQNVLVSRGRSLSQQPASLPKSTRFTHTFKSFKTLFRSRTTNPTRVVKALQTIGNAVRKALGTSPDSEVNGCSVRLEDTIALVSHGCLTTNEGALQPTEVVVPMTAAADNCDYTLSNEAKAKLLSRATEIMNEDARRRFCFGVTCEGPEVTLWRFARSIVVKSTPFDMTEQPDLLVKLFVALFSTPLHQLGYDPLVTLLPDGNYIYQLSSSTTLYFKTIRPIWDVRPTSLSGRRTRIWEVEQVISPAQPTRIPGTPTRALKDVFLSSKARTEADVQDDLFADIAKLGQDPNWRSRPLLKDFSPVHLEALAQALEGDRFKEYFSRIIANHLGEDDHPASVTSPTSRPKRRCLFLYEHICTPLNNVATLGEAVDILKQALIPLHLMFCAGWVHRDISPGNILARRDASTSVWQVKLSDLEHAKRFPDCEMASSDHITGTPYFIACEILEDNQFFPQTLDHSKPPRTYQLFDIVHTYQYDLESIWWILLWLVTVRVNQNLPKWFGNKYFQQRVDLEYAGTRAYLFTRPLAYVPKIKECIPQELLSSFFGRLDVLRNDLYREYVTRNRDGSYIDIESYSWIASEGFNKFYTGIEDSRDEWGAIDLIVDTVPEPALDVRKEDPSPPPQLSNIPLSNKRKANPALGQGGPLKKRRSGGARDRAVAVRVDGPVTRSMTRNAGPMTRSATRRLQEAEKRKLALQTGTRSSK